MSALSITVRAYEVKLSFSIILLETNDLCWKNLPQVLERYVDPFVGFSDFYASSRPIDI